MTKGKGKYQTDKEEKALTSILKALSERKEQRYKDIKKESNSNDPTLQKYLKQFIELKMVEKRIDFESGKYPYPVYYRITPIAEPIIKIMLQVDKEKQEIIKIISDPKKTPLDVLDQINTKNNALILSVLKEYKNNKDVSQEFADLVLKLVVWYPYMTLTSHLIEESKKNIGNIDIENLQKRNKTTIRMDKAILIEISGWTEKQINSFYEKIGHSDLIEE